MTFSKLKENCRTKRVLKKVKSDRRSKFSNLSNWKGEAWKISGLQRDSNPWPLLFFMLLSSSRLNWKIYCDDHSSLSSTTAVQYEFHIYFTSFHCTRRYELNKLTSLTNHSSVGRASHRYRGSHGFKSRWSLVIFRLLPSNCLNVKIYCDDHSSPSLTAAVQCEFHIYFTKEYCPPG